MSPYRLILPVAASASEWSAPAPVFRSRERQRVVHPPAAAVRSRERQRVVRPPSPSWAA